MTSHPLTSNTGKPHIIVVGGGLAGLSAAVSSVDAGARVTLIEKRPRFGGATWSFDRNNLFFDSGQHVYLACCKGYQWFLDRIGTSHLAPLRGKLNLAVLDAATGKVSFLKRRDLKAPLHLADSILKYSHITAADKAKLGWAAIPLMRVDLNAKDLDAKTLGEFLKQHKQSDTAIANFWEIINLATTNVTADEVSLTVAAKVFKTLLTDQTAGDLGWSLVPLNDLHSKPALELLAHTGADIIKRTKVMSIVTNPNSLKASPTAASYSSPDNSRTVTGVITDGSELRADAVIIATDHIDAAELLPQNSGVNTDLIQKLQYSPIINVHLVFDKKVMPFEVAAAVNSPAQFVFDTTQSSGLSPKDGQCLAISISAAEHQVGMSPKDLIDLYTKEIEKLFPKAKEAKITDAVVSRETRATMKITPGVNALRPTTQTGYRNLFLAGAWTATGWPITMESAVLSGLEASKSALHYLGFKKSSEQIGEGVLI
ncbi:MAG: hydroxysqualene dehydroxylase HpnE [Firmicutes bacterium]|nr:hydroxysqualene dehydroxylase HpnE [Bacillota bacterium]